MKATRETVESDLLRGMMASGVPPLEAKRAAIMALAGIDRVMAAIEDYFAPIPAGPAWTLGYGIFLQLLEQQAHGMGIEMKAAAESMGFAKAEFSVGGALNS